MLLWLNTGWGRLRRGSLSVQVTQNDKLEQCLQQQSLRCSVPAEMGWDTEPGPTWPSTGATGKARRKTDSCLSHRGPLEFPESHHQLHGATDICNVRLPQAITCGRCTLCTALGGVAGIPCCCSPGELLGCARSPSMPRLSPSRARHPSSAGFLWTRMAYYGGHR